MATRPCRDVGPRAHVVNPTKRRLIPALQAGKLPNCLNFTSRHDAAAEEAKESGLRVEEAPSHQTPFPPQDAWGLTLSVCIDRHDLHLYAVVDKHGIAGLGFTEGRDRRAVITSEFGGVGGAHRRPSAACRQLGANSPMQANPDPRRSRSIRARLFARTLLCHACYHMEKTSPHCVTRIIPIPMKRGCDGQVQHRLKPGRGIAPRVW